MTDSHITTVQDLYGAFGRGDVETILEALADDVDWAAEAAEPSAPWQGVRHGKAEVASFFQELAGSMEVTEFTPLTYASNGDDVLVVIDYGVTSRVNGKSARMQLHHWWRFRDGKVCYWRGTEDTAATAELLAPQAVPAG